MQSRQPNSAGRRPSLAVICPVFNEEESIPLFFERISTVFSRLEKEYESRLYFAENGSSDSSLELIRNLHRLHPNVFAIVLSRNFGYQNALETSLKIVEADLYVMIDVDCEDPPEMIEDFLRFHREGFDIVYGERVDRIENAVIKAMRRFFYKLVRSVADDNFVLNMAEFCVITSEVRNAILQETTSFPFIRSSIGRIGFARKGIPYKRHKRIAGKTHYNFVGMTVFAIASILSASTLALRIAAYAFPFWTVLLFALAVSAWVWPGNWQVPAMLLAGFTFVGFTVMVAGLYVARIYKNGLGRPNAIVRRGLSILPPAANAEDDVAG